MASLGDDVNKDAFRDRVSTIDEEGKRQWIFPKKPKGNYYKWRTRVSWVLLFFFFAAPWIKIKGEPLLLLNVMERKFVIFGQIFWPQDFFLFVIGMITSIVFIILFTVVYGRIFCGWVCPQTIFMEMVFRRIEYWIDGDFGRQKKLAEMPWNAEKIRKRVFKHGIFILISLIITNLFLQYLMGVDEWMKLVSEPIEEHQGGFVSMLIFTFVFYGVFSWFREQVCTVVCPYGRLQGVLIDSRTINVTYDFTRGENRARFKRREDRAAAEKGDCIDCGACVDVCPTGIDIRNGTQLECINCTACIDACDAIMDKVGFEKGLIRYASETEIKEKKPFKFNIRIKAYTIVLGILVAFLISLLALRTEVDAQVVTPRGAVYQKTDDGRYSNIYTVKVLNKTGEAKNITLRVEDGQPAELQMVGTLPVLDGGAMAEGAFMLLMKRDDMDGSKTPVKIGVFDGERQVETIKVNFSGPLMVH